MSPATWPRSVAEAGARRVLYIDPRTERVMDATVHDLPGYVNAGDVWVVNDAATLPASISARMPSGVDREIRIASMIESRSEFWVVLFGAGDWRTPTEHRDAPEVLTVGDEITVAGWTARVDEVSRISKRLVRIRFDAVPAAAFWWGLYGAGRAVQYSYIRAPLALWDVQTSYGGRPWASEAPSAGLPLNWGVLLAMRARGARVVSLTHAAGLSSTGDPSLDAALPLPERFDIPADTVRAIEEARARGGRVVAVGTSVVRALEGCAAQHDGRLSAGEGVTDLRLGPDSKLRIVDGLFTGVHEIGTSHFELLSAFVAARVARGALAHAEARGYLGHEFGDSSLILAA